MIKIVIKLLYPELAFNLISKKSVRTLTAELDPNVFFFYREFSFEFFNSIISILG